jgi:hypothetical protein
VAANRAPLTRGRRWEPILNVLFVTSWYPTPEFTYGGVFVREHAKACAQFGAAGFEIVVFLTKAASLGGRRLFSRFPASRHRG